MNETSDLIFMNHLDELAAFEPTGYPFISLYLNLQPDQHGRDNFDSFVRKEFKAKAKSFPAESLELMSFNRDTARIKAYLRDEIRPSANGLAIFACAGANDYFKAVQLNAPLKRHDLHVNERPHLYPLARVIDQFPRYIALLADTNSARLFVFGLGKILSREEMQHVKVSRTQVGGWSQMRYQRHVDNFHLQHAKEVVEVLDRVVREEAVEHIILAGDEVIIPLLREQLPDRLSEKVIDVLRLDIRTPEHEVLQATMDSLREHNLHTDAEKVRQLFDEYRGGGLAVVTWKDTVTAMKHGQVDELLLSASAREIGISDQEFDNSGVDQHVSDAPPVSDAESSLTPADFAGYPGATDRSSGHFHRRYGTPEQCRWCGSNAPLPDLKCRIPKERRSKLSSKNNVNRDHYKMKGRGRPGAVIVHEEYKRLHNQIGSRRRRGLSAKQLLARKLRLRAARQTKSRNAASGIELA